MCQIPIIFAMDSKKINEYVQNVIKKRERIDSLINFDEKNTSTTSENTTSKDKEISINNRKKKIGKGYLIDSDLNVTYKYYKDVNILIKRLKLLLASEKAGNDSHNEIQSILYELSSSGVIRRCPRKKS